MDVDYELGKPRATYKCDLTNEVVKWGDIKDKWPITVPNIKHDDSDDIVLVKAICRDELKLPDKTVIHEDVYLPITEETLKVKDHTYIFYDGDDSQSRCQYFGDLDGILKGANITI